MTLSNKTVEEKGIIHGQYIYLDGKRYKIASYNVQRDEYTVCEVKV